MFVSSKSDILLSVVILLGVQLCPGDVEGANVLFFIGFGGPSHRIAVEPLANALIEKGHNVTFLTQSKPKDKTQKYEVFVPQKLSKFFSEFYSKVDYFDLRNSTKSIVRPFFIQWFGVQVCESLYADNEFLEWLESTKFDLVILDGLFNDCGYGVAHVHGAKTIYFSISSVLPWVIEGLGLPDDTSSIPDTMLPYPQDRTFFQRMVTAIFPVIHRLIRQYYYFPALERITKEGLKQTAFPSFAELERNTSLVLLNTYVAQEYPRSLPTNVISVGGISRVYKEKPIPINIEDFINEGIDGFVYISFGSWIDFLTFPNQIQQQFINALRKFPHIQFIWKLNKTPENLPKNILVEKWLPQQDLLLHPKIRAFITHAGIGGVNEAIYSSVPLICFPIFTEQDYNAYLVQQKGFGIKMEITTLTEDDMVNALNELLNNESYRKNVKKVKNQFLDRPMKPLESAVWWVEWVLRQENTDFLRPLNLEQSWWVKRQLDVWLFVLLVFISCNTLSLYVIYAITRKLFKRYYTTERNSSTKKLN